MSHALEAILLALGAIWAHKLRSLLTVMGNIVAVTSIIAVVTLIQGLNVAVSEAITSEAGADAFMVERVGIIRDEDEAERARRLNPRITMDDAAAIEAFSDSASAVMAKVEQRGRVTYRGRELERTRIEGVSEDYLRFSNYGVEHGRLITSAEVRRRRPVAIVGWGVADRLFESVDPLDKTIKIADRHFRIIGVSGKKGAIFGQSQDEFVIIPLGAHQKIFGIRRSLSLMVKPEDPGEMLAGMEEAVVALRIERQLKPTEENNFGLFTSGTILGIWEAATSGSSPSSSASSRCRWLSVASSS